MWKKPSFRSSQRGAVVIQVAVFLLALLAFSAFVVDYGVMWASRAQAQTSADAGALTAAIALAFEDGADFDGAKVKAQAMAKQNGVFGQQPDVLLSDITFPTCPPGAIGVPDTCVKVDVFRNQRTGGNPLPTFFGNLVGVTNQGVRATATAQVATASTTDCLRPWAVLDRWDEYGATDPGDVGGHNYQSTDTTFDDPDWSMISTYDKYSDGKGASPPQEDDLYVAPSDSGAGTGFRLPDDGGRQFAIKTDTNENTDLSPGWFRAIRIPRLDGGSGGDVYRDNIGSCGGYATSWFEPDPAAGIYDCPATIPLADEVYWAARGCFNVETGNKVGPTSQGIDDLYAADEAEFGARTLQWVGGIGGHVEDTAAPGVAVTDSPLIVPIGVIDIDHFLSLDPSGHNGVLKVTQIYGFFIEGMGDVDPSDGTISLSPSGKAVIGRLMRLQGTGASTHTTNSTFLRSVMLIR